jgi:hypothetical protein
MRAESSVSTRPASPFWGFGSEFTAASRSARLLSCIRGGSPPGFAARAGVEKGQNALVAMGRASREAPAASAARALTPEAQYAFRFCERVEESEGLLNDEMEKEGSSVNLHKYKMA